MNKIDREWVISIIDAKFRQYELANKAAATQRTLDLKDVVTNAVNDQRELLCENLSLKALLKAKKRR